MSTAKPNEHADQNNPENQGSTPSANGDKQGPEGYVAPFFPYDGTPLRPNRFMVTLKAEHTMEEHWKVIGERLGVDEGGWYSATLSEEQIERIRRDRGVKEVRQYGRAVWG